MTREEFEILIGRKVEDAEYALADAIYNRTGMEKQEFCDIWEQPGSKAIYKDLLELIEVKEAAIQTLKKRNEEAASWLLSLRQSGIPSDSQEKQINMALELILGKEQAILHKLKRHLPLSEREIECVECYLI